MCAHNPTGVDPTKKQWRLIADTMEVPCNHVIHCNHVITRRRNYLHYLTQLIKAMPQGILTMMHLLLGSLLGGEWSCSQLSHSLRTLGSIVNDNILFTLV